LCNDPPSIQNEVGNLDPGMGQAQKCGGVKAVDGIPTLHSW